MPAVNVRTAVVYTCRPDAGAAMAALSDLTRVAEESGYRVRTAVSDTTGADMPLALRPGWRYLNGLIGHGGAGALVTGSTGVLAADSAGRWSAVAALAERGVEVEAVRPTAREVGQWMRIWRRPAPLPRTRAGLEAADRAGLEPRSCCVVFPARPEHARDVRKLVSGILGSWGSGVEEDPDLVAAAVNELVVNAITHGSWPGDPVTVTVERAAGELRVGVADRSPLRPHRRDAGMEGISGRGLAMVAGISDGWGTTRAASGTGKTVWMRLRTRLNAPSGTAASVPAGEGPAQHHPDVTAQPCGHLITGRAR
ncbi:ATP-binding protein [Streptomyces uncialis]|uniref:ATP-binding protein n=1 Tax=Streptomyces uncialis TaxID=1048205 RepID=UPI0037F33563